MTTPAKVKLLILQGATFRKRLRWSAPSGTPIDLTDCTARMQVREEKASPTVLLSLSTENAPGSGRIVLGAAEGTIDLYVSADITAGITWTGGVWDLEITLSNGDVVRLAEGSIGVSGEVTRDYIVTIEAVQVLSVEGRDEVLAEQIVTTEVVTVEETVSIALEGRDEVLTEVVEVAVVMAVAEQGPPGRTGAPGPAGGQMLQRIAGQDTSALVAVYEDQNGAVWPADPDVELDVLALLGVTVNAASGGQPINVQRLGYVDDSGWQWQPGKRVFLGQQGRLTQQPPLTGYDVLIGVALSATRLLINIQDPIELE